MAHSPLFQLMFAWQNNAQGRLALGELELEGTGSTQPMAQFDLSLNLQESEDRIVGGMTLATALFDRPTIERHLGYLKALLAAMCADDTQAVARIALLDPIERHQLLVEFNDTRADFPAEHCIHELFEAQVERTPEATAVVFEDESLSYRELNQRANRLAHHLRSLGVQPDERVALCVPRSIEMVVGLLAVLKAGAAYVPLDPAYPRERLAHMLADSAPVALLSHTSVRHTLPELTTPVLDLLADAALWRHLPASNPTRGALQPNHLAYVIYTSGSTGQPKGVMVEHRGVCNQIIALQRRYGVGSSDRVLQFASLTFDMSVEEIFTSVLSGAALVLRTQSWLASTDQFQALCDRHGITVANLPTIFWQQVVSDKPPHWPATLRQIMIGGEAVGQASMQAWFASACPRPQLFNAYGPTEATVNAAIMQAQADPCTWRLIGHPIANTSIYILDPQGQPTPLGVPGEIHIGGVQVARGYLNRHELSAERFVADPFSAKAGARMYKTGDLGRWLPEGNIEFLGRNDHQVKIRGFRIELGEIEARLASFPGVREAVVLAREDLPGDKRLVAYLVGLDAEAPVQALREHLGASLPEYMVPAAYVSLEALPLTPNGKLDRRALPAPEDEAYASTVYEPPQGEVETTVAAIWSELLGVAQVGRRHNFFELGGHSLLAVQLASRVRTRLGVEVALAELFAHPTLAGFSQWVAQATASTLPAIAARDPGLTPPLSFAQQRLWFID